MTDSIWTNGITDRDLDDNGNWSSALAPISDDRVYFLSDYSGTSTGPADQMDQLAAVEPALVYIGEGYTEDIGAAGAGVGGGMDFNLIDKLWHRGTGKCWVICGGGASLWFLADSTAPDPTTSIMNVTGTTLTLLDVLRGGVNVDSGATITTIRQSWRQNQATDANLTIDNGATIATVEQHGGIIDMASGATTVRVFGGTHNITQATVTTLEVWGGQVNFNFAGSITTVRHYGGVIDVTRAAGPKTFVNYYWYPQAELVSTPGMLTVTNEFAGRTGSWT